MLINGIDFLDSTYRTHGSESGDNATKRSSMSRIGLTPQLREQMLIGR